MRRFTRQFIALFLGSAFFCAHTPGTAQSATDAKPVPPSYSATDAPPQLDCNKTLDQLERDMSPVDNDKFAQWIDRYQAMNTYFDALIEWDGQQFVKAGKWTPQKKKDFEAMLLARPELTENWSYFSNASTRALSNLSTFIDKANKKDDAGACRAFNAIFADMGQIRQRGLDHSAAIDRLYQAEAAKIGLTL
ncbi:MAG: hypothetical protein J7485_00130 [Sphingobium sp.]|nr:hypothetical protein [Sphingobium sp.]